MCGMLAARTSLLNKAEQSSTCCLSYSSKHTGEHFVGSAFLRKGLPFHSSAFNALFRTTLRIGRLQHVESWLSKKEGTGHVIRGMGIERKSRLPLHREVKLEELAPVAKQAVSKRKEEGPKSPSNKASLQEVDSELPALMDAEAEPLLELEDVLPDTLYEGRSGWSLSKRKAELLLFLVPLLWGTYGPTIKYIYESPGPPAVSILTTLRSALSVVAYAAVLPFEAAHAPSSSSQASSRNPWAFPPGTWQAGTELGIWNTVGTALQMIGLQQTTATQAGFLIQTVNILVPLILLVSGHPVRKSIWLAAPLCITGVLLLSSTQSGGSAEGSLTGDAFILGSALCYAMFTVRLGVHAQRLPSLPLTAAKMAVGVVLGLCWMATDWGSSLISGGSVQPAWEDWANPLVWGLILYSSLFPGALASLVMAVGQRSVPAAEAQIVYSSTPLFTALLSFLLLHEVLGPTGWAGGALLVAAAVTASMGGKGDTEAAGSTRLPKERQSEQDDNLT